MKKKICILLTVLMAFSILPAIAFAAEGSLLSIDNEHIYFDMKKPYNQGYEPIISDGKAIVVLPLHEPSGPSQIAPDGLTVSTNLGDAATCPFVYGNYDPMNKITYQNNDIFDGNGTKVGTQPSYLITIPIPLKQDRVNGQYPVVITVKYNKGADPTELTQTFTVYMKITDGIDPNATPAPTPTPTPEPTEAPIPQPKLMVQSHTITPEEVMAGTTFDLNVTLKNTSEGQSVQNIKITAKGDTTDLIPAEDTGSTYIKKIGSGDTTDFNVKIQVRPDAKPGPQKVLLAIEYENSKATAFTANEEIIVQVKQPIRLEYDDPTIPESVNAGDTISISMNLMNMGKSTLYNVRCTLEAPGLIPEGSVFIGNMEPGTSKTGDIYVFVDSINIAAGGAGEEPPVEEAPAEPVEPAADAASGIKTDSAVNAESGDIAISEEALSSKEMAVSEEAAPEGAMESFDAGAAGQYGPTQGRIVITYEDEYGTEYSQDVNFSTVINPPVIQPVSGDEEPAEEPETVSQWWISVIIAGGIAAGLIAALRIRRKKRMLLEDDNENE